MKSIFKPIALIALILLLTSISCSRTRLMSSFKDEKYTGGALKNVLVVGVTEDANARRIYEAVFVKEFEARGVEAVSSGTVIASAEELRKDRIKAEAQRLGVDAIFVTHLLGVETKTVYNPPIYEYDTPMRYDRFDTYYPMVYGYVNRPGYYSEHEYVKLETNLYQRQTGKLIWSASTETVDSDSANQLVDELSKVLMRDLQKKGLIN